MTRGWKRLLWTLPLVFMLGGGALWLKACFGPDTNLVFTWERNPDLPLKQFAAGRLGLLQPFYARSYLVVAYRYLMDRPLTAQEQIEAVDLWDRRLNGGYGVMFDREESVHVPSVNFLETPRPGDEADDDSPDQVWFKARSEFMAGPPPELRREDKRWDRLRWFQNIQGGAFRTSIRTLQARVKQWGGKDPRVNAWIRAQDQVFSSTGEHPNIPAPLGKDADPLLIQDRVYQIASAKFYAQRYDEAIQDFEAIAGDTRSPWSKVASYMTARCWFRKGESLESQGREHHQDALQDYRRAIAAAEKVPDHPTAHVLAMTLRWETKQVEARGKTDHPDEFDAAARFLAKAAAAREHPLERTRELASILTQPAGTQDFGVDLGDYTILLDRHIENEDRWDWYHHREFGPEPEKPRSINAALLQDDMTNWVYHARDTTAGAYGYAHKRWTERKSLPWLLLALASAGPSSEGLQALLTASGELPETHPGFPMAAFHRARLLLSLHRQEEARPLLDHLIALGAERISPSAMNLARALRLPLARSREELVEDLLRQVVGIENPNGESVDELWAGGSDLSLVAQWAVSVDHAEGRSFFKSYGPSHALVQADGATLLNLCVPTSVMVELAKSPKTPAHLRREWLRCAWARYVVLDDLGSAFHLAPEVIRVEPELKAPLEAFLAADVADRANVAAWILVHHPGLRWYVSQSLNSRTYQPTRKPGDYDWVHGYRLKDRHPFRDSFWPRLEDLQGREWSRWSGFWFGTNSPFGYEHALRRVFGIQRVGVPVFLNDAERSRLDREAGQLKELEDGPTWLCKRVLAWTKAHPEDPRIPEALHYAVRATRIGGATDLSKACFQILHRKYGKTPWATKTPYYF